MEKVNIFFSEFFDVSPGLIEEHGAVDVSLVSDLPLFIDPFLLFNSDNPVYQGLHEGIIRYLKYLRDNATAGAIDPGLLNAWYRFSEVKQTWLGFSKEGNRGSGLGADFAKALHGSLHSIFANFGRERVAKGSHLEKLCLISPGIGRDNISDFTTNLIKEYLLDYTQAFAQQHIKAELRKRFIVPKVRFNFETGSWERGRYDLPCHENDYVLLTPQDMLTRDTIWISRTELVNNFEQIALTIPNDELRAELSNYITSRLSEDLDSKEEKKERARLAESAMIIHPEILDYYIREKEDTGDAAVSISSAKVRDTRRLFVEQVRSFVRTFLVDTEFYELEGDTYEEARKRLLFFKDVIEHNDGYRLFYLDDKPVKKEDDVQLLFRFVWQGTPSDVNREVNNGRGPVDYKVSRGDADKTLVEFKLASNSQLKKNLQNQVKIYEQANQTKKSLKAIVYFSEREHKKVLDVLNELGLTGSPDIILIDARADNKPSASKAA